MYKKILIPTDGSPLAVQAANAGITFARSIGAEVVALNVTQPFAAAVGLDAIVAAYPLSDEDYEKGIQERADKYLNHVIDRGSIAGVTVHPKAVSNINVPEGIVQVAEEEKCDLIFIGSHGRNGLARLLLGSVTAKVLSLATIGVLVYRVKAE